MRGVSLDAELHLLESPLPENHLGHLSVLHVAEEAVERSAVDRLCVLLSHLRGELFVPLDLEGKLHQFHESLSEGKVKYRVTRQVDY